MLHILAHRGIWKAKAEQNTVQAFQASFECGAGIETDLRDLDGDIVVSHDPPRGTNNLTLDELLKLYKSAGRDVCLALNIKSDGIAEQVKDSLERWAVTNYFCFDMSVPDMRHYARLGLKFATRFSEYEPFLAMADRANAVWVDRFSLPELYPADLPLDSWPQSVLLALVSPELHGRPYQDYWLKLKQAIQAGLRQNSNSELYLCTDFVGEAQEFFKDV